MRPLRVLLVDDDPIVARVMQEWLQEAGHDVTVCTEGAKACWSISVYRPDVVLLDVLMPDVSGIDVALMLKREPSASAVAIILVSSMSDQELSELVQRTGALGAIQKTHDQAQFVRRFRTLVDERLRRRAMS
jgi:PleD family two-component response regulator